MRMRCAAIVMGMCLALGACQQEQAAPVASDGNPADAEGEVLPGTISDAMIPYDQLGQDEAAALPPPVAPTQDGATASAPRPAAAPRTRPAPTPSPAITAERASPSPTPDEPAEAAEE